MPDAFIKEPHTWLLNSCTIPMKAFFEFVFGCRRDNFSKTCYFGSMVRNESITVYYRVALEQIKALVISQSDEYILGVNPDEYAEYLYSKYELPRVERDPAREISVAQERSWQTVPEFRSEVQHEFITARIEYPIVTRPLIEQVLSRTSSSWSPVLRKFEYHDGIIIIRSDPEPGEIKQTIENLEQLFGWKNADVEAGNKQLRQAIPNFIRGRVEKVRRDKETFEKAVQQVSIPLKIKNPEQLPMVDLRVRKELRPLMPPKAEKPKEFFLEKVHVLTILEMISRIGFQFEVTPKVFGGLEEESLRDVILSNLNTVFQGGGTGETFSKLGKTDIHLNIAQGSILIAECKYWEGEKAYHEAIDQLFRYLTWRQNYGILIIFSRRHGFTSILETAKSCIRAHKTYKSGFSEHSLTHFESHHFFPEDQNKTVEIHHLIFNLYIPKE